MTSCSVGCGRKFFESIGAAEKEYDLHDGQSTQSRQEYPLPTLRFKNGNRLDLHRPPDSGS